MTVERKRQAARVQLYAARLRCSFVGFQPRRPEHFALVEEGQLSLIVPNETCILVSWLPQYHDMGLICSYLGPLVVDFHVHYMSPISFIRDPILWVELISRSRAHVSVAPDFAYRLVARKFRQAKQQRHRRTRLSGTKEDLDLSSVRTLAGAAEPNRPETKSYFEETFAPYGLPMNWYGAGYGLAEHVVFVSLLCDYVVSTRRGTDADDDKEFIACGHTKLLETSRTVIKIVNSETRKEVEEGVTGEIWISGPSKASGYYGKPQLSEETFRAKLASDGGVIADVEEYLCTGDLGFFQEGYLYIGGRRKDLIIVNGVNYYPQDIEYVVQEASMEVKGGCVAAFSADEMAKDGSLEIVFEVRSKNADYESLCSKVGSDVREKIGHSPSKIVILGENIPKTTSGKIRRRATREAVHLNQLHVLYYWADNDKQVGSTSAVKQKEDDVERGGQDVTSIFVGLLGEVYDENKTWEELGLSSMASIELQNLVVQNLGVAST